MLRIAHLSDFHISNTLFNTKRNIVAPLIKDLSKYHEETKIDLIICSGDLVDVGGGDFESPSEAFTTFENEIVKPILEELGLSRGRFFFAPGNHDVDVSDVESWEDNALHDHLSDVQSIADFIEKNYPDGYKIQRIKPFKKFERQFRSDSKNIDITAFESTYSIKIQGEKIGIAALNSAWRCHHEFQEKGRLVLGKRQIEHAVDSLEDSDIRIAIVHHPTEWLRNHDRSASDPLLTDNFDLLFSGHIHEGDTSVQTNVYGTLFRSVSPGILSSNVDLDSDRFSNGYLLIDYKPYDSKIVSHVRKYSSRKNKFIADTERGDEKGIKPYNLPATDAIQKRKQERELAEKIRDVHFEDINTHLLTHGTDTQAPTDINDIFVMPKVVYESEKESDKSEDQRIDEERFNLSDLVTSEDDLLLLGRKETGKTILLDRLLIEFTNSVQTLNKIPVYIDFSELGNSTIKTAVKRFLNASSREVEQIASDLNLVLLIDDISFTERDKFRLKHLKNFIDDFPRTQIIATHLQMHSGDLPIASLRNYHWFQFKPLYIQSFKIREIKTLVSNWFESSEQIDTPDKVKSLVQLFEALDIPRTPLSVSIFLWIFEKQENYRPTNESTMLENFLERLFKKHDPQEMYSGRFDYKNKQRLIAHIAYFMHEKGEESYRVEYPDLINFVSKYLDEKKFEYSADRLIDDLLSVGIFTREDKYVRFRFTCFFEFYLMKKMQSDDAFRATVLSDNTYLRYINEIDYLTGIERDCDDILEELTSRLEAHFEELIDHLRQGDKSFDDHLESSSPLLSKFDPPKIMQKLREEKKPSEEDLEAVQDTALEVSDSFRSRDIERKKDPDKVLSRLGKALMLTAKVLKNTEETDRGELKKRAYRAVIRSTVAYSILYREALKHFLEENEKSFPGLSEFLNVLTDYMPLFFQVTLHSQMGTQKLIVVIREEIERTLQDSTVSNFEKFLSVFLYADLRGKKYTSSIKDLIKSTDSGYIQENTFTKLLSYYYLRSKDPETDQKFVNLIADLLVKARDWPKWKKGDIIAHYSQRKKLRELKSDEDQTELPFD